MRKQEVQLVLTNRPKMYFCNMLFFHKDVRHIYLSSYWVSKALKQKTICEVIQSHKIVLFNRSSTVSY